MEVAIEELARPETNADTTLASRHWCGTCQEAGDAPVSSAGQHLEPGWALAAVRAAVREGRLTFPAQRPRPDLASPEIITAVREHRANPTKYERRLNIPADFAQSHERGKPWQQHQMCARQWQQLQAIRERDRLRKQRKSALDRAVEQELQTLLTQPQRETVAV